MRVCVYCGSSSAGPVYLAAARQVGATLARRGIELVYGGARVGTMGAVADGALQAGGRVIGVIPQSLTTWELAHNGLTELRVVAGLHERKATMTELSDAVLALPGGAGTLDELFEAWTWAQLKVHTKPVGVLNVANFFDPLLAMVDHMAAEGFLKPAYREMLLVDDDVDRLLDRFADYRPPDYTWSDDPVDAGR
ncbi:LOG family protein [Saccharothrix syringae]|uniref:Cytokinin riboside 5'-monophosphate phosphoribohydrolase n=1 Tax=Saccharothrix syringae TaxID=103733 RepID=A0A5Q0H0L4_SACSY|nr:TIGR00730 family Rossman fold protein [Saccharothrix syringae]QFZ19663.1 TIGR00730 family Rossman fold protein [Saccharothrix syringae]